MIRGKIIIEGKLELLSPAIIGCGKDERTDTDVIRDSKGKPFIPATSFIGVLRHSIKLNSNYAGKPQRFWGSQDMGSLISCRDLTLSEDRVEIVVRDGVKISTKRGIAEEKGKFDYEVIERGTCFNLYMEVDISEKDIDFIKQMVATIIELLNNEKIRIGAKTTSGFGKVKLINYKIYEFDFQKKEHVIKWLKREYPESSSLNIEPFPLQNKKFIINAQFKIKNSLIIRSYTFDFNKPDAGHIKSKNKPILPGTSLKGAIRARAERILNTINKPQNILLSLFGDVNEKSKKGRITVEESILPSYAQEIQTRIKIDRFTGGTIEGALFESMPLFKDKSEDFFDIKITIDNYQAHEAGLILLVVKDLWTGDLPIGGEKSIGRGILEGKRAEIKWDNKTIIIEDLSKLSNNDKNSLEKFVQALVNYGR